MHDLGAAVEIDRDHLLCSPVGEPEAAVVPARLLSEDDAGHEYVWCLNGLLLSIQQLLNVPIGF